MRALTQRRRFLGAHVATVSDSAVSPRFNLGGVEDVVDGFIYTDTA